jgi:hypothetical protein
VSGLSAIAVRCTTTGDSFRCQVSVGDDPAATRHEVTVTARDLERLAPGATDPTALLTVSFEYLLEREPREAILRHFDLSEIERYFPTYPREIVARTSRPTSAPGSETPVDGGR